LENFPSSKWMYMGNIPLRLKQGIKRRHVWIRYAFLFYKVHAHVTFFISNSTALSKRIMFKSQNTLQNARKIFLIAVLSRYCVMYCGRYTQ
jgi:hypothetical protein